MLWRLSAVLCEGRLVVNVYHVLSSSWLVFTHDEALGLLFVVFSLWVCFWRSIRVAACVQRIASAISLWCLDRASRHKCRAVGSGVG